MLVPEGGKVPAMLDICVVIFPRAESTSSSKLGKTCKYATPEVNKDATKAVLKSWMPSRIFSFHASFLL